LREKKFQKFHLNLSIIALNSCARAIYHKCYADIFCYFLLAMQILQYSIYTRPIVFPIEVGVCWFHACFADNGTQL